MRMEFREDGEAQPLMIVVAPEERFNRRLNGKSINITVISTFYCLKFK